MNDAIVLVYDAEQKAVACAIVQATAGCSNNEMLAYFNHWLTCPTKGMKRYKGTREQWEKLAEQSNAHWKEKQAIT